MKIRSLKRRRLFKPPYAYRIDFQRRAIRRSILRALDLPDTSPRFARAA